MVGRNQKTRSRAGRLRIVAGNWRSRLLDVADVEGLRPTSERVRETLFNWLTPRIHGARCLDLFAGTGALGLEALSRGAHSAVFVERSSVAVRQLRKNIDILDAKGARVVHMSASDFLRNERNGPFDVVFLDPPFAKDLLSETCRLLADGGLLTEAAVVYLELARDQDMPTLPEGWQVSKDRTAGKVRYALVDTGR